MCVSHTCHNFSSNSSCIDKYGGSFSKSMFLLLYHPFLIYMKNCSITWSPFWSWISSQSSSIHKRHIWRGKRLIMFQIRLHSSQFSHCKRASHDLDSVVSFYPGTDTAPLSSHTSYVASSATISNTKQSPAWIPSTSPQRFEFSFGKKRLQTLTTVVKLPWYEKLPFLPSILPSHRYKELKGLRSRAYRALS